MIIGSHLNILPTVLESAILYSRCSGGELWRRPNTVANVPLNTAMLALWWWTRGSSSAGAWASLQPSAGLALRQSSVGSTGLNRAAQWAEVAVVMLDGCSAVS